MTKTPKIDEEKCIGCGLCTSLAPDTFEMGDDGKAHVKNPDGSSQDDIQNSIDSCPVQAISWSGS